MYLLIVFVGSERICRADVWNSVVLNYAENKNHGL